MKNNIFLRARLKLTAYYAGSILAIIMLSSFGIFFIFSRNFDNNFEYHGKNDQYEKVLRQKVKTKTENGLLITLVFVDLVSTILASAIGWYLAGNTLHPIKKALDEQKRFVSDAAHELRTPLSVMLAGLQTVNAGGKATIENYRQLNSELIEEIRRLVGLSNDLLFLSTDGQATVNNLEIKKIDISSELAKQSKIVSPYAKQKKVKLRTSIQPGLYIKGDKKQIEQLLVNLIKNAIDYNKKQGIVTIAAKELRHAIILNVKDTGIGISRKDLKHIFSRFYKADQARARGSGGAGLGLSIAKQIIESHHAKIKVNSRIGQGTNIRISFRKA